MTPAFFIAYISGWHPVVLGVSLALLGHILTDQLTNRVHPLGYFFTYRPLREFRTPNVSNGMRESLSLWFRPITILRTQLLHRWYRPKIRK